MLMHRGVTFHPSVVAVQSVWACILMALVGFLLALNKERFPKMQSAFSFALLTYPIVAIPGTYSPCSLLSLLTCTGRAFLFHML